MMTTRGLLYILDGKRPVECTDPMEWARWFCRHVVDCRKVAYDAVDGVGVSTVFLGSIHGFSRAGQPLLFETMVFGGPLDQEQERCATWDEAEAMHAAMVARVRDSIETVKQET